MTLHLIDQESCFREELVDNGKSVKIHYVVKKTPFVVRLAVSEDAEVNFKTGNLECVLMYENSNKQVTVPDGGPSLEFRAHNSEDGLECTLEVRAYLLTTQANGIRFVIAFRLGKTGTLPLTLESHPLVVVSKQQQIRNKEAEAERQREPHNARAKKRVRTEDVYGLLDQILSLQRVQADQLAELGLEPPLKRAKIERPSQLSVDEALSALVAAYRRDAMVAGTNRAENLRRLVASQDSETQQELRDIGSYCL